MALIPLPGKKDPNVKMGTLLAILGVVIVLAVKLYPMAHDKPIGTATPPEKQKMILVNAENGSTVEDPLPGLNANSEDFVYHHMDSLERDDSDYERARNFYYTSFALQEAFGWLKGRPQAKEQPKIYSRREWNYAKIMREVNKWRLSMMHVYGILLYKETVTIDQGPIGMRKLYLLLIHDRRQGISYHVLTPMMPKDADVVKGDKVTHLAFDGLYLMRYPYHAKSGMKSTPLFAAMRVYKAKEGQTPPDKLDERGDPGEEYKDIIPDKTASQLNIDYVKKYSYRPDKKGVEGRPMISGEGGGLSLLGTMEGHADFREVLSNLADEKDVLDHFFEYVWHFDEEELKVAVNPDLKYDVLMAGDQAPEGSLGQIVRLRGRALRADKYEMPKQEGFKRYYLVYANDSGYRNQGFTWTLATLNLPEGLREDEEIEAEGAFFKLFTYKTLGGKWHWSPLVVVKNIRRVPPNKSGESIFRTVAIILFCAILLIIVISRFDTGRVQTLKRRSRGKLIEKEKDLLKNANLKVIREMRGKKKAEENDSSLASGTEDANNNTQE